MIKIILLIGDRPKIAIPVQALPHQKTCRCPVDHRLKSHGLKIPDSLQDHSFKAKRVSDIYDLFLTDILVSHQETDPVPLCIGICHQIYCFLRQVLQMLPCP